MARSAFIVVGTLVMIGLLAFGWAMGQVAEDEPESASRRHADLHARYAEARVRLAEARLQKAEALNTATPGLVTESDLRSLRTRVELLRADIEQTRRTPHGNSFVAQRRAAHAAVQIADQELQAALAVNRRHADAISPLDMRLRELRLDVARRRAEVWDDPAFLASSTDVLQLQIDQIVDQLQDVLHDVETSPPVQRR